MLSLCLLGKEYDDLGFDSILISKSHWQVCLSICYICRRYLQVMVLLHLELFYLL